MRTGRHFHILCPVVPEFLYFFYISELKEPFQTLIRLQMNLTVPSFQTTTQSSNVKCGNLASSNQRNIIVACEQKCGNRCTILVI